MLTSYFERGVFFDCSQKISKELHVVYNRERYFPTLQDYRTYAEKLFSETSNVKNILIEGMHYTRFLLYLNVLYEEIFQEDCDLSKNYRAWYANLLRWHFFGWRIHPVHCPVRLHYRKWRCLNEIFRLFVK